MSDFDHLPRTCAKVPMPPVKPPRQADAQIRADRIAAKLPAVPDPVVGDLAEVLRLRGVIKVLSPFMVQAVEESVEFLRKLESEGLKDHPEVVSLRATLTKLAERFTEAKA